MKKTVVAAVMFGLLCACGGRDRWIIDDASFYPVTIDYWPDDHSFLIGSYENGAIARVSVDGTSDRRPFLSPSFPEDGRKQALRIRIDGPRDRLWVLDSDRLYIYSLRSRELLAHIDLPRASRASRSGCLPDMALNPFTGAVYIADGQEPKLHAVEEESVTEALVRTEVNLTAGHGSAIGKISALAVVPESDALIAGSADTGALWQIDAQTGKARRIEIKDGDHARGICALRPVVGSPLGYAHRDNAPRQFYFTSMTSNALYGLALYPGLERGYAVALTRAQALEAPIGIVPVGGYVVAVSSQLGRHKDLGGADQPALPFRVVPMPAATGPLASDTSVAGRSHDQKREKPWTRSK
jgi:hypothetical protein